MDGTRPETCPECGFDSSQWRVRDAGSFFGALGFWWRHALAGVSADDLNRRPGPDVWSVLEYGLHSALVTAVNRVGIELILDNPGTVLPDPPPTASGDEHEPLILDAERVVADLEREGTAMAEVAARRDAPWSNVATLHGLTLQAEALLFHAAHDASHHFLDVSRGLAALGVGAPPGRATVVQLNTSGGGVPKRPVTTGEVTIGWDGLAGDVQSDRKHHGRPFQAVSLWSAEVIASLAGEGHPIAAGSAGENLTLSGLDWATMRPGARLQAGTALLEVSFPATPCHHQSQWFTDGDFNRILHDRDPASTRWYAWVRKPGVIGVGDTVTMQAVG